MGLKPGQITCIQTLDRSLVVSAGAGSGKTFTLTRRIVHALKSGAVDDVGRILAITFTKKAAAELKSRIKGALRAEGMIDQSLKVDAAWISTIHGACARILRAHALEIGIDPTFKVLDDADASPLMDAAIEEVLADANDLVSPEGTDALFAEYSAHSHGRRGVSSVDSMVRTLVRAAAISPLGVASFVAPVPADAGALVRQMVETAEKLLSVVEAQKPSSTQAALAENTRIARDGACEALAGGDVNFNKAAAILNAFPVPGKNFGTTEYKQFAQEATETYLACMAEVRFGLALPLLKDLRMLASRVLDAYCRRKREVGGLDNDDLLIYTARAFESSTRLAAEYADRFQLVMVDEFQDTDQLQVDMIKRLSGSACERLCVVGDAQQSIYRFRGADVSVYRRHVQETQAADPKSLILLPDNFRSHADVLTFVDRVFEQPQVFGSNFMSLTPSRDEARVTRPFFGVGPRIDVQLVTSPSRGVAIDEVRRVAARGIAQRFSALRAAGHTAADMVLLLGSATHANVYADELRSEGFACVVVKGSVFNRAPEVQLMVSLAQAIANPLDSLALFEVLSSEMFALSADDFLELTTFFDDELGIYRRCPLLQGILQVIRAEGEDCTVSAQLMCAARITENMILATGRRRVAAIMADMVRDCGWFSRLESEGAEGQARAANVLKAIRMVEQIEAAGAVGPASVAEQFAMQVEVAKEAPGALSAEGGEFVRIMTIHASKGLEFPCVAVAEIRQGEVKPDKLMVERVENATYVSLDLGNSLKGCKDSSLLSKCSQVPLNLDKLEGEDLIQAVRQNANAGVRRSALRAFSAIGEEQESRRLLYVAFTRAKEALIVSLMGKRSKSSPSGVSKGINADIQSALCGPDGFFPEGIASFDYGGSRPAAFERVDLVSNDQTDGESKAGFEADIDIATDIASNTSTSTETTTDAPPSSTLDWYDVPIVERFAPRHDVPLRSAREGVFSYSSLAAGQGLYEEEDAGEGSEESARADHFCEAVSQENQTLSSNGRDETRDDTKSYDTHSLSANAFTICSSAVTEPDGYPVDSAFNDEDDAAWAAIRESLRADSDATDFGTAFHRLAQYAVVCRTQGTFDEPPAQRVDALCRRYGLDDRQQTRLMLASKRWFSSSLATCVATFARVRAEVPFFCAMKAADSSVFLEGEIDLLADEGRVGGTALIVDYKTGGKPNETQEHLHEKHVLQASCYAYAVLRQGYDAVEAVFVRVEHEDKEEGGPQCVRYSFAAQDLDTLETTIREAHLLSCV